MSATVSLFIQRNLRAPFDGLYAGDAVLAHFFYRCPSIKSFATLFLFVENIYMNLTHSYLYIRVPNNTINVCPYNSPSCLCNEKLLKNKQLF